MNMKHFHSFFLCASRFARPFLLILFVFLGGMAYAQPGTPSFYDAVPTTSTNTFPFASATNKVVWVHPPGSFTTTGTGAGVAVGTGNNITKIYIRMVGANPSQVYTGFEISMTQTGATTNTFTAGAGQPFVQCLEIFGWQGGCPDSGRGASLRAGRGNQCPGQRRGF